MRLAPRHALAVAALALVACAKSHAPRVSNAPAAGAPPEVTPLSADGAGSTVALAVVGDRHVAFASDEDDGRIHAFDVERGVELAVSDAGGTPAQIVLTGRGTLFVALRDRARIAAFRVADRDGRLEPLGGVEVAVEPVALALARDERTLFAASGWGGELAAITPGETSPRARVKLAREPRAVVAAQGGTRVFVAHAVDDVMSTVSFEGGAPVTKALRLGVQLGHGGQGYALASYDGRVYAPHVLADPDTFETYYGSATMRSTVEVLDAETGGLAFPLDARTHAPPQALPVFEPRGPLRLCLLPRAIAVRPTETPTLLVACAGDDSLLEYRAGVPAPAGEVLRRIPLEGGVSGVAVDPGLDVAVAWAQHTRRLAVIRLSDADGRSRDDQVAASFVAASGTSRLATQVQLGRRIFHAAGDTRLSADGRACASCHPDGRDDGRTWTTPDGRRQTMMLAGRVRDTAPYGWKRRAPTLKEYFNDTIRRLRGRGLPEAEQSALESYLLALRVPAAAGASDGAVGRGKQIFESAEAGCATCHAGSSTSDGAMHDVGSGGSSRLEAFETPSLRFVGHTAPYFHDGRYLTLRALLNARDTKMGSTKHLAPHDVDALEAYLKTL